MQVKFTKRYHYPAVRTCEPKLAIPSIGENVEEPDFSYTSDENTEKHKNFDKMKQVPMHSVPIYLLKSI